MARLLSKRQKESLNSLIEVKKEDDNYRMTDDDRLIENFLDFKLGIKEYGLTVQDVMQILGEHDKHYWRTKMCTLSKSLWKDGFPFGGLKPAKGELMRYGWAGTIEEKEQLKSKFKKNLVSPD